MPRRCHSSLLVLILCATIFSPSLFSNEVVAVDGVSSATSPNWGLSSNSTELTEFLDERVANLSEKYNVAGMSISVVKDGQVMLSKGYGYSEMDTQTQVSANYTLFRIGSISKTFTWTAVMQLVEDGKIDLDANVNLYFKNYHVPDAFGAPITMRNLMTHTAGFDESDRIFSWDGVQSTTFEEYLVKTMPERIRAPGELITYSNHGVMLAALIVQDVSGMPFYEYIEKNIITPLDLNHTSPEQPLPDRLAGLLSSAYFNNGTGYEKGGYEYVLTLGAGEIASTAQDMSKWMILHLQYGIYDGTRILNDSTSRYMQSHQFSPIPAADGICLGFYEMNWRDNVTIIGHGGDTALFHSEMVLFPQYGMGLFVTSNTASGASAVNALVRDYVDHYFPIEKRVLPSPGPDAVAHAQKVAGVYQDTRVDHNNLGKFIIKHNELKFTATGDGYLTLHLGTATYKLVEVATYHYAFIDMQRSSLGDLIFILDSSGQPTHFVMTQQIGTFERLDVMQQQGFNSDLIAVAAAVMASSVLWIALGLFHRVKGARGIGAVFLLKSTVLATCGVALAFTYLMSYTLDMPALDLIWESSLAAPQPLASYTIMPAICFVLLICSAVLLMVAIWRGEKWKSWEKVHVVAVMVGIASFLTWAKYWNML